MQLGRQLHADNRMKRILGGEQQSAPFARPQIDEGVFFEVQLEAMKDLSKYGRGYPKVAVIEQVFSASAGKILREYQPARLDAKLQVKRMHGDVLFRAVSGFWRRP